MHYIEDDGTMSHIGSHWDGCWRAHHDCAIAEIERLRAAINAISAMAPQQSWGCDADGEARLATEREALGWVINAADQVKRENTRLEARARGRAATIRRILNKVSE